MTQPCALAQRVLSNAAKTLHGSAALASYLKVDAGTLKLWLKGEQVPPVEMVLLACEVLIENSAEPPARQSLPAFNRIADS